MRNILAILCCIAFVSTGSLATAKESNAFAGPTAPADTQSPIDFANAQAFVSKYCVSCHGPDAEEGDRRFDSLVEQPTNRTDLSGASLEAWHEVLDRVNLADMPPEDAPRQPTDEERLFISESLTKLLSQIKHDSSATAQTVLRRLNRVEYDAAIRDVLAIDEMLADPSSEFVPDEKVHQFQNIGQSLVISNVLMGQYLDASGRYLEHAMAKLASPPKPKTWKFTAPFFKEYGQNDGLNRPGEYQHLRENPSYEHGYLWLQKFGQGVPASGHYKIRIRANAIHRDYPYKDWIIDVPREDPLRLGIVATDTAAEKMTSNHSSDKTLAVFTMADDEPQWFETTAWLDQGYAPRFTYPNGPAKIKYMRHLLMHHHRDSFKGFIKDRVHLFHSMHPDYDKIEGPKLEAVFLDEQERLKQSGQPYDVFGSDHSIHTDEAWSQFFSEYQGPRIRVYEIEISGPVTTMSANEHRVAEFFPDQPPTLRSANQLINQFASRAYRRPTNDEELQPIHDFYKQRMQATGDHLDALRLSYQSILCSPSFLYHRTKAGPLDHHEMASRLSFFLWSQPPDEELRRLADQERLLDPKILREQTNRLLDDPRNQKMVASFIDAWLQLGKLGTMPPSRDEHPEYFNERLEEAMRKETQLFVSDMLHRNVGVSVLIDNDYTFLNSSLARLYDIPNVHGHEFRRVPLDTNWRGGLLGQGSVLTATANGIDTSPVLRGVWVLESLLGTPPSPPPPDVEPIEPDTRGAVTIRQQLQQHRDVATCANCHKRIDPPGFALESYDEIGRYREQYLLDGAWKRPGPPVDPSGQLGSGESFDNIVELKRHLMSRLDRVTQNLASSLLTHATGRLDDPADRADMLNLLQSLPKSPATHDREAHGVGMRTLLHAIVQSEAMRR